MKLLRIEVENFRCFERLSLDLHPELTILIAPNGAGKTTLLDAARIALWPFVKAFDLGSQTGKSATIQIDDVRLASRGNGTMEAQLPSSVSALGHWSGQNDAVRWSQMRERVKPGTNTLADLNTKGLTRFGAQLQAHIRDGGTPVTLPLISYLGTSRLWYQGRHTASAAETTLDKGDYSRTSGYLNCLTYTSSFKQFSEWYGWIYRSYRELQLIALEQHRPVDDPEGYFSNVISVVKNAINALIAEQTGWHDLEYSARHQQQLVLHHASHGVLPIDLLSDGLRNTISLVADLAFRAFKLNPHLGANAALQTPGIALIDEVDMFLHPSWQQTVLASLRSAFPCIQFVVTTHSPQVLSSVHRDNIRVIAGDPAGRLVAEPPLAMTYGEPSGEVMHSVMMVDPQPPVPERAALDRLTSLVDQGNYGAAEARQLMAELTASLGEQHPQLQRLKRSIHRQEILLRGITPYAEPAR